MSSACSRADGQPEDAPPCQSAEPLFGVRPVGHHHLAKGGHGGAGLRGLRQHSGRGPLPQSAMRGRHMVGHSDMVAPTRGAHMACNPLAAMEYLDRLARYANVDLLFDQGEGDGIPRAVDFDVVIRDHAGPLPTGKDIGLGRQRLQVGLVQGGQQIGPAGAIRAAIAAGPCVARITSSALADASAMVATMPPVALTQSTKGVVCARSFDISAGVTARIPTCLAVLTRTTDTRSGSTRCTNIGRKLRSRSAINAESADRRIADQIAPRSRAIPIVTVAEFWDIAPMVRIDRFTAGWDHGHSFSPGGHAEVEVSACRSSHP